MSNVIFNIESFEMKRYSNTLRDLHRKHLPSAARSTLNDAALYVKVRKTGMNTEFESKFKVKKHTFLQSHSWATKATGFDINKMEATVGVVKVGGSKSAESSIAAQGLKLQEFGGSEKREYMYNAESRGVVSKRKAKRGISGFVNKDLYLKDNLSMGVTHGKFKYKGTKKSRFVAAAFYAKKFGLIVKHDKQLFKIIDVKRLANKKIEIEKVNFANVDFTRHVNYKQNKFLLPASERATKMMGEFYKANVEFQLKKSKKNGLAR